MIFAVIDETKGLGIFSPLTPSFIWIENAVVNCATRFRRSYFHDTSVALCVHVDVRVASSTSEP